MKATILKTTIFIFFLIIVQNLYSQYNWNVEETTPEGTDFYSGDLWASDLTLSERNALKDDEDTAYPNAVRLANPTREYNCHYYAFETSFNSSKKQWLNAPDVYLDDCSYLKVTDNNSSNRVLYSIYGSYSHSSVATTTTNIVESKWGYGSLMRHSITDCTYARGSYTTSKFRRNIVLSGSGSVNCTSETYTSALGTGYTSTWNKSSNLSITSSYGSATVTPINGGSGYVRQTVTKSGCSNRIFTKSLSVTDDVPDTPTNITEVFIDPCFNSYLEFDVVDSNDPGTTYNWTVSGPGSIESGQGSESVTIETTSNTGYLTVGVRAQNVCGNSSYIYNYNTTIDCGGGGQEKMMLSPVPSNQFLEIDISNITKGDQSESYILEVYDIYNGLKKSSTMESISKSLYVGDLQEGIYIVVLKNSKNIYKKKFIKKR